MKKLKDEHRKKKTKPTITHHFFRNEQILAKGKNFMNNTTQFHRQMQSRCFCCVCLFLCFTDEQKGARLGRVKLRYFGLQGYVPLTTSCWFSEKMTLAGVGETCKQFTEAPSMAGRAWKLQLLCQAEMGDRHRVPGGERSMHWSR